MRKGDFKEKLFHFGEIMGRKKLLSNVLVETSWLAEHLDDPNIRVVEIVGMFIPPNIYGHIPNTVIFDWRKDLWHPIKRDFVDKEGFEELMKKTGISNDTTVICCSLGKQFATYAFWVFKYYGHKDVRVLNGGLEKWIREKRPLIGKLKNFSGTPLTRYKAKKPDMSIRVFRDYVLRSLKRKMYCLLMQEPLKNIGVS